MMWVCLSCVWGPGLRMTEDGSVVGMASDWLPEAYTAKSKAGCVTGWERYVTFAWRKPGLI